MASHLEGSASTLRRATPVVSGSSLAERLETLHHFQRSVRTGRTEANKFSGGMAAGRDDTVYVTGFSVPLVAQYSGRGRSRRSPLTVISGSNTDLVLPTFVFAR